MQQLRQAINDARITLESNADWKQKYDYIFALQIPKLAEQYNLAFPDYYDPDIDYEDDIRAFMNAVEEFATNHPEIFTNPPLVEWQPLVAQHQSLVSLIKGVDRRKDTKETATQLATEFLQAMDNDSEFKRKLNHFLSIANQAKYEVENKLTERWMRS